MISSDETTQNNDDTTPPTLTIITPADNSTQSGLVTISVVTNDDSGIKHVEFFIDSSLVNTDTESPYQYQWDSFTAQSGTHTIKVVSTDSSDNSSEQSIDVIISVSIPTIVITSPSSDTTVTGTITVTVNATAYTDKVINNVEFYINNSLEMNDQEDPYEYALMTNNYVDGVLMIKAIAYDNYGDSASDSLSINILNSIWMQTYGDYNRGNSVQQTTDGGYIVTGQTNQTNDIFLLKTDAVGDVVWNQTFGGSGEDEGYSVQETNDGGFIVSGTGIDQDFIGGAILIKTDASGNEQWNKAYSGTDKGYSVQQTTDGGFVIGGTICCYTALLLKTDSNGNQQWIKSFDNGIPGGSHMELARSVQQTTDGGYIITGQISNDVWLIKTDSNGNEEWNQTFGGSNYDIGSDVQQTSDGGYIIAGTYNGVTAWLIKTDSQGTEEWNQTWGSHYPVESVKQTDDGGFIIAGITFLNTDSYALLLKTDALGNEEWYQTFGGIGYSEADARSVDQTTDGGYIITGRTIYDSDQILWLIKTDFEGNTVDYP